MQQDYTIFTKQDFLQDNLFIQHVKYPNATTKALWERYALLNPGNYSEYLDAVSELEYILQATIRITAPLGLKHQVWENIQRELPFAQIKFSKHRFVGHLSIAASIFIASLTIGFLFYHFYYSRKTTMTTSYNMVKEVLLPDSSRVVLNANSGINYSSHWKSDQPREIWLNGEAYFEVVHQNKNLKHILNSERFIVHAGQLEIQVLGTVFNVRARSKDNSVVLVSGKVAVKVLGQQTWKILLPGESFKYSPLKQEKSVTQIDPAILTAWKDRSVILSSNTRLTDIIPQLEENYGVHIKLSSADIGDKAIEGTLPLTNQENLFFILTNVLKVDISREDSTWTFSPRKPY